MKRTLKPVLLGAALLLPWLSPGAWGLTVTSLTLTTQAQKAQIIVRATLGTPVNSTSGGVSWLSYPLTVTETIAGDAASLPQQGGQPALMFLAGLQDLPTLNAGQDVFLLLYSGTLDSPLVGFNQGVYPVVNGQVTRWNEAALTAEAARAAASSASPSGVAASGAATTGTTTTAAPTGTATSPNTMTSPNTPASPNTAAPSSTSAGTTPTTTGTGPSTASRPATDGSTGTAGATAAGASTTPSASPAATGATATPATATATAPAGTPSAATGTPPGTASPAAAAPDPNAIERDPAKFREQLRAARNSR